MNDTAILDRLLSVANDPFTSLADWKNHNDKKIIGCLPMYFPEELIHAAGMLPIVVPEDDKEPISVGHAHMQTYICGYARSTLDIALKGKLSFLDGYVTNDICHSTRGLAMMLEWDTPTPFYKGASFPQVVNSVYSGDYLMGVLKGFRSALEKFTGHEITDAALRHSIVVFNKNRTLLRKLYQIRRAKPAAITGRQMWAAVYSSMLMPKEEHSELVEELLPQLQAKKWRANGKVRLVVSGGLCEGAPPELFDLIEELGGVIVDDDLYVGARYVGIDARITGDPLKALVDRFLNMTPPCPTRLDNRDWSDYLINMTRRGKARGMITVMGKYCEPHAMFYPHLLQRLKTAGIPELMLETEHGAFPRGQFRTRLEAFLEMARGVGK